LEWTKYPDENKKQIKSLIVNAMKSAQNKNTLFIEIKDAI
jgi:hypothetical protein